MHYWKAFQRMSRRRGNKDSKCCLPLFWICFKSLCCRPPRSSDSDNFEKKIGRKAHLPSWDWEWNSSIWEGWIDRVVERATEKPKAHVALFDCSAAIWWICCCTFPKGDAFNPNHTGLSKQIFLWGLLWGTLFSQKPTVTRINGGRLCGYFFRNTTRRGLGHLWYIIVITNVKQDLDLMFSLSCAYTYTYTYTYAYAYTYTYTYTLYPCLSGWFSVSFTV